MDEPSLRDEPAESVDDPDEPLPAQVGPLACGNGGAWGAKGCGPCAACAAEADRLAVEFAAQVQQGRYDARGYEPGDRPFGGQGDLFA